MGIAPYQFGRPPGSTHKAPSINYEPPSDGTAPVNFNGIAGPGGCWVAAIETGSPELSFPAPATFYPAGTWLPPGTTQYAVLYAWTNRDRVAIYNPYDNVLEEGEYYRMNSGTGTGFRPAQIVYDITPEFHGSFNSARNRYLKYVDLYEAIKEIVSKGS